MNFKKISAIILSLVLIAIIFLSPNESVEIQTDLKKTESSNIDSSQDSDDNSDEQSSQTEKEDDSDEDSIDDESSEVTVLNNSDDEADLEIAFSFALSNSWKESGSTIYEYKGYITNNQDKNISNWVVNIPVESDAKVKSCWSSKYEILGKNLKITPENFNKQIPVNGKVDFGFQLQASEELDVDKIKLSTTLGDSGDTSTPVNSNNNNNNSNGEPVENTGAKDVPEPTTDDWLFTKGNKIVDSSGKEVWLTGVNWFGYNTGTNCFDGLWAADLNSSIASIADHGFNLLRVPISTELVNNWEDGDYPNANFNNATNSYLVGMNSLEIFDYVVGQCRANGIKIMIDFHCAKTDSMGHMKPMWYEGNITEDDYIRALEWMANRYKNDDTIIAFDIENEPHGKHNEDPRAKWDDSKDSDNWKYIAEKAAKAVLAKNPNVLIMVEGIEIYPKDINSNGDFSSTNEDDYFFDWWGGNLRGVKDNPIDLGKYQNKLVYSPHDYGPTVYQQPWFQGDYTFDSLYEDCWKDNWMFIYEDNTAPLLIGEWGGFMREPNLKWMTYLRKLIKDNKLNHTFWCFNSNSGDTGGLVLGDFTTWDTEKYSFVKEVLWQKNGKFVGLDHEIPLGENGITLSDY